MELTQRQRLWCWRWQYGKREHSYSFQSSTVQPSPAQPVDSSVSCSVSYFKILRFARFLAWTTLSGFLSFVKCRVRPDTRKMMKIGNAVGKIGILHMINGRMGKILKTRMKEMTMRWSNRFSDGGILSFRTPAPATPATKILCDTIAKYAHFVVLIKKYVRVVANFHGREKQRNYIIHERKQDNKKRLHLVLWWIATTKMI